MHVASAGGGGRPTYPCTPNILQKKTTHTQTNKELTQCSAIMFRTKVCFAYFQIVS